jgi:hypothetical protein
LLEESQLLLRQRAVEDGLPDPGRPAYADTYTERDRPDKPSSFSVHFREDIGESAIARLRELQFFRTRLDGPQNLPPFPSLQLIASVNITVRMRTGAMCRMSNLSDEARVSLLLILR